MPKSKSMFICNECGYESSGWLGKCPSCMQWNTFIEEFQEIKSKSTTNKLKVDTKSTNINDVTFDSEELYLTGIKEMDRVLGGGIVKGSLILVGGDPGIGKSTLLLQICESVNSSSNVLYVSGEESIKQIKIRANRLMVKNPKLSIISEISLKIIEKIINDDKPDIVIIDSIQTMINDELGSAPGSVTQVREVTASLMRIAKTNGISILIVGHVTKEGAIAGPRVLEHMVDTVLYFEGERHLSYRILRAVKNRFGSTNEIGIFEMKQNGLEEVDNPSAMLLSGRTQNVSGSAVVTNLEGTRPMLIEVQALVCHTSFGMPRRMATGMDYNRIILLIAVLEKIVGIHLNNYDAYVNVVGGLKIDEPACDLGIIAAIASSFKNSPICLDSVLIGEVGLTGEVRPVSHIDKRINEASRIGFKTIIIPEGNMKIVESMKLIKGINIKSVKNVQKCIDIIF